MEPVQESRQLDDLSDASAPAGSWDSDSPSSSRSVSTISYEYNPDDFPRLNEIEEFQSPSFVWPPSPSVSGRHNSLGRSTSIQGSKKMPKKLAAKLQTEMDYLAILLSLSDIVPAAASFAGDAESMEVIEGAQQTLHKASARAKALDRNKEDLDEIFRALQTSVTNISSVLEPTKVALAKPIQLAELVVKTTGEVPARYSWYRECQELKSKSERLTRLLLFAASINLYDKPLSLIVVRVERILFIAGQIAKKHRNPGNIAIRILISSTSANTFKKISVELDDCIVDISWLIRKCTSSSPLHADIHEDIDGVPPSAVDKPMLRSIWKGIAMLLSGSPQDKIEAAKSLASLAADDDQYGKMIIEEGGEEPLVKLGKEGEADAQEEAIKVLGFLGRNLDNAMMLAKDGSNVFSVLASVLNDGPIQVQACAAWAVNQLAAHYLPGSHFRHMTVVVEPLVKYLIEFSNKKDHISAVSALFLLRKAIDKIVLNRLMFGIVELITEGTLEVQYSTAKLLLELASTGEREVAFKMIFFDEINQAATIPGSPIQFLLEIAKKTEHNEPLLQRTTEVISSLVGLLKSQKEDTVLQAVIALTKFTHEYCTLHEIENPRVPLIAIAKPIVCASWQRVATMRNKSANEVVATAVLWLASFADHNDQYGKIIIDNGGVKPLSKLVKEGEADAQVKAIEVLGLLGRNLDNAMMLAKDGSNVFSVLASVLNDGPIQVQASAAWAVNQLAAHYLHGSRFKHMIVVVEPLVKYLIEFSDKKDHVSAIRALFLLRKAIDEKVLNRLMLGILALIAQGTLEVQYISWLIRKFTSSSPLHADIHEDEPILYLIKAGIATLLNGSPQGKIEAAMSLASLAADDDRYGKMIIEEGGVEPLLKLVKEGEADIQVQACAAWAVSQLAAHYLPGSRRFEHLALVLEPLVNYLIKSSMRTNPLVPDAIRTVCLLVKEDPDFLRKAVNEKVLNRLMLCIPALITRGTPEVQHNTAKLLLEFVSTGERDNAFKMIFFDEMNHVATIRNSPIEPLLKIAKMTEYNEPFEPFVNRTMEVIGPLVRLLKSKKEEEMVLEAIIALTMFTHKYCTFIKIMSGVPPIALSKPIIIHSIWETVAKLRNNSADEIVAEAVAWLMSLAGHSDRYGKSIIEEGGVEPLLNLASDYSPGKARLREIAITALGFLCRDSTNAMMVALIKMRDGAEAERKVTKSKIQNPENPSDLGF